MSINLGTTEVELSLYSKALQPVAYMVHAETDSDYQPCVP